MSEKGEEKIEIVTEKQKYNYRHTHTHTQKQRLIVNAKVRSLDKNEWREWV